MVDARTECGGDEGARGPSRIFRAGKGGAAAVVKVNARANPNPNQGGRAEAYELAHGSETGSLFFFSNGFHLPRNACGGGKNAEGKTRAPHL